jgi:hypothetical protein
MADFSVAHSVALSPLSGGRLGHGIPGSTNPLQPLWKGARLEGRRDNFGANEDHVGGTERSGRLKRRKDKVQWKKDHVF